MTPLLGQTVVVIGGSSGIGLATARMARAEGADVVLTARDPDRLQQAASEIGAQQHGVRRHRPRPARRVLRGVAGPDDVAAVAIHVVTNTALTLATFEIDGGQQLVAG